MVKIKYGIVIIVWFLMLSFNVLVYSVWEPSNEPYRPIVGGARIEVYKYYDYLLSEKYVGYCTVGYAAVLNGKKGYVTSGHCFDGTVGDFNEPYMWWWNVYQPYKSIYRDYYSGSPIYVKGNGSDVDVGFVEYSNVSYRVLTYNPSFSSIDEYPIDDVVPWVSILDYSNVLIWKTGAKSGITNGHILGIAEYWPSEDLKYVIFTDLYSDEGDSGGPVYIREIIRIDSISTIRLKLIGIISKGLPEVSESYVVSADGIRFITSINPIMW